MNKIGVEPIKLMSWKSSFLVLVSLGSMQFKVDDEISVKSRNIGYNAFNSKIQGLFQGMQSANENESS